MPGRTRPGRGAEKSGSDIRRQCRRTNRWLDESARHRSLDRQLHCHARAALARRISCRRSGLDARREVQSETIAATLRGLAAVARIRSPVLVELNRSRAMNIFCYVESPIGRLMLTSDGSALTGLYINLYRNKPTKRPNP